MQFFRFSLRRPALVLALTPLIGLAISAAAADPASAPPASAPPVSGGATPQSATSPDGPAAYDPGWSKSYPQQSGDELQPFPDAAPGDMTPQDLYRYTGRGVAVDETVDRIRDFAEWSQKLQQQKPRAMAERRRYMQQRYDFHGRPHPTATMSRGKPVPAGPAVKLPAGVDSWEELAALPAAEIRGRELFPEGFRPLSHPLHATGHMLFPEPWTTAHPEHERLDIDFDIPEAYLPEFPPPLFLTTRPDLGDVSQGHEIKRKILSPSFAACRGLWAYNRESGGAETTSGCSSLSVRLPRRRASFIGFA